MDRINRLVKVCAASIDIKIGNVLHNTVEIEKAYQSIIATDNPDIIVFPELCITGYSCKDMFRNDTLVSYALAALKKLAEKIKEEVVIVGLPVVANSLLYNCAAVLNNGEIKGIIPKSYLPTYGEFEEARFFKSGIDIEVLLLDDVPFGTDLLFYQDGVMIGVEICEDLWTPIPPSSKQAIAGANILCNLSASNDIVGKDKYRRELVANQSGRCVAAYVYSCASSSESTTDTVMAGHHIIAQNGKVLSESPRKFDATQISSVIDMDILHTSRANATSFNMLQNHVYFRMIPLKIKDTVIDHVIDKTPFIPKENTDEVCEHILEIQTEGLAQRLRQLPEDVPVVIGVSGGLDSTLALLVAVEAFDKLGRDRKELIGITMPGFGTSGETLGNARLLMEELGITYKQVNIHDGCEKVFTDIGHDKNVHDVTFENVQARYRTLILMSHGFVIGTGDMSEIALGWCTYNGDHMSMYNVNCSIPKTLVKTLVQHHCNYSHLWNEAWTRSCKILKDILNTEISPELLPAKDGKIQSTEDTLGPYELHDFFLANFIRYGYSTRKLYNLACLAFEEYDNKFIKETLKTFIIRFFKNQFKRSCVPDGPKVGTVSLSPRGDWRMPSDFNPDLWLLELEALDEQ